MEGYDAKFDPPLEKRLECPICLLAQREPMQTPCGHRFCSACILRALRETGPRCPVDNTTVCVHQLFKDNFAKREVLSLNVHCSADECGCSWQGELRDLQVHSKQCKLVLVECPNSCGHSCRRIHLQDHVPNCTNRPAKCPTCSIHFPRSCLPDHQPHCSHLALPDSIIASLDKACELLKWVGHLKLKINGQATQVTGYLTAPVDSEESHLPTGCWCSTISLITLNSLASRIFSRMLQSSEVQRVQLNFALLSSDAKSIAFQKIFRKKPEICNAAVCVRLRPGNRRETRELTIMYLCWCDQRKRLQAYVANLKTHLVRQIQSHLHEMQGSRRHRRMRGVTTQSSQHHISPSQSQSRSSASTPHNPHTLSHTHPRVHAFQQPPLPQPQQMINIHPHHDIHSIVQPPLQHQVVAAAAGSSPAILPNLLSWQMSQSFNTYPWRMQANGVPFFTFPSTPPSYIPANSYPYTFAPLPAAPFSISPMQPVPSTVHVPSYNGLSVMVPQVTTVDTGAVPLNANQSNVVTQGYAVAAPTPAVGPSQPVVDREMQAVAVHVLQPHTTPRPDHQLHQYQNMTQAPLTIPPAAPPALIPTEHPLPLPQPQTLPPSTQQANNSNAPFVFEVITSQPVHVSERLSAVSHPQQPQHIQQVNPSLPPELGSRSGIRDDTYHPQLPVVTLDDSGVMWGDVPGPSGQNQAPQSESQSDSSRDSTPEISSFPSFSPDNDSDNSDISQTPDLSVSPSALFDESNALLSSDQEDTSANASPDDISTDSTAASALHTLADAAAILAESPTPADTSVTTTMQSAIGQPVRMPVLINISDSESESHLSPSPIIDLTHSPSTSTGRPTSLAHSSTYNYSVIVSTHDNATHSGNQTLSRTTARLQDPTPTMHGDSRISAVLVPVIHQWNGAPEHQGLRPIQHYVSGDQVGVVQAAQMGVEEVAHMVRPSPSLSSETPIVAPVQLQQPYPVREYASRATAAVARWPTELPAPGHAVQGTLLYPPQQPVTNTPHGDFWDTVIPSLVDRRLQNSTNSDN